MSVIFITGANRGIGLSLTQQYLEGSHKVYATYRDANSAKELLSRRPQQQSDLHSIRDNRLPSSEPPHFANRVD